jgi:phage terminase large subunit-like protein
LRDRLIDDVDAQLGQAVDVGLARAIVAPLDRVVEEPVDAVAVVLVVLRGVDAPLRGDRVRAARGVVINEALHVVAELRHRGRRRGTGKTGTDDDDVVLPFVGRIDELVVGLGVLPLLIDRSGRGFAV